MNDRNKKIIEMINNSDNPFKMAIDLGCQIKLIDPTEHEKKHRILTIGLMLPGTIHDVNINMEFQNED